MKDLHQNAIKYLTYLILNKRKLDNKQAHVPPTLMIKDNYYTTRTHLSKEAKTLCCITERGDQHKANGLTFIPLNLVIGDFFMILRLLKDMMFK